MLAQRKFRNHFKTLAAAAILAVAQAAALPAQTPSESAWDNLRQIKPGQEVQIVLANAQSHKGKFVGFSGEAVSLLNNGSEAAYQREDVVRISLLDNSKRNRNTALGLAIGGGVGAVLGGLLARRLNNEGERSEAAVAFLAPTGGGAAIGALVGRAGGFRTIYRSPAKPDRN